MYKSQSLSKKKEGRQLVLALNWQITVIPPSSGHIFEDRVSLNNYVLQLSRFFKARGKKMLRTTDDIVQFENVLQKDSVREKAEEIPADAGVDSQEPQYVNVFSQDSDQKIQTNASVPFLDIVYNESELDRFNKRILILYGIH